MVRWSVGQLYRQPSCSPACCSEDTPDDNWREGVLAIRRLNEKLGRDARVTTVMINIGDGYTLATKL